MEVKVEELDALKRKIQIEVPKDVVSIRVHNAYKELNRQIKMPGFRPGKIPMHILEKQVPIESFSKMFQDLMQEYYEEALKEIGIEPAGPPEINHDEMDQIKKDAAFNFSVTVDIKPDFKIGEYLGLKMKRYEVKTSEEEVESILQRMLEAHGHFEPYADGYEAQKDDFMKISFKGFLGGEPLERGDAENYEVRLGEKKMIEGFEDQLIGHKAGENINVRVSLPRDWNNKMRRVSMPIPGVENDEEVEMAEFKVNIHEVKKLVVPELDDSIAKAEGLETVEELRRKIKTGQQAYKENQDEMRVKNEIFEILVNESEFDPPDTLVNRELRFVVEGMKFQIEQSGMKVEDSGFDEEVARKEWRDKAVRNTKGYLVLEEIANRESIHVSEADMEDEYKMLAEQTKQTAEDVKKKILTVPESFEHTKTKLRGRKTLDFLFSNCEFDYVNDEPDKETQTLGK